MFGQLIRFGVVGAGVNATLYVVYLVMVDAHVPVKLAMSTTYACGMLLGFALNRRWTFRRVATSRADLPRYLAVYFAGYLMNLSALLLFVDELGFAHEIVQAVMVFVVAIFVFLLQKYWTFGLPGRFVATES